MWFKQGWKTLTPRRRPRLLYVAMTTKTWCIQGWKTLTRQRLLFYLTVCFFTALWGVHMVFDSISAPLDTCRSTVHVTINIETFHQNLTLSRKFTPSEDGLVFILGVVAKNSTPVAKWDTFSVYGQWYNHTSVVEDKLRCCLKFSNGTVLQKTVDVYYAHEYDNTMYQAKLIMWHITCVNKGSTLPTDVSISRESPCKDHRVAYVRPYFTYRQSPDHLVITTKLTYGTVNPEIVVSFLEAMRHFGVDKVITYIHVSLDQNIRKILLYYASTGLLEYHKLQLADHTVRPKVYKLLDGQYMNDEWLMKRDAIERSSGSEYFGIFDMDEFLVPSRNRSWKQLLRDLRKRVGVASHFFFKNVHYVTDVEQCNSTDPECSFFKRYAMLAPDMYNSRHEKAISIISRVHTYSINNHYIGSKRHYTRSTCPESEAYVRHYGSCWRKFLSNTCNSSYFSQDTHMAEWADRYLIKNIKRSFRNISKF